MYNSLDTQMSAPGALIGAVIGLGVGFSHGFNDMMKGADSPLTPMVAMGYGAIEGIVGAFVGGAIGGVAGLGLRSQASQRFFANWRNKHK